MEIFKYVELHYIPMSRVQFEYFGYQLDFLKDKLEFYSIYT